MGLPSNDQPPQKQAPLPKMYQMESTFNYLSLICLHRNIRVSNIATFLRTRFKKILLVQPINAENRPLINANNAHMLLSDTKLSLIRQEVDSTFCKEYKLDIKPFMLMVEPIIRIPLKL